jgi:hypothetical protein
LCDVSGAATNTASCRQAGNREAAAKIEHIGKRTLRFGQEIAQVFRSAVAQHIDKLRTETFRERIEVFSGMAPGGAR